MPLLYGPADQEKIIWQNFKQIDQMLAPLGLNIKELELNARHAWRMQLNTGVVVVMGRLHIIKRVQRLINVYAQVFQGKSAPTSIDLRYNNGLAVKW